MDALITIIAGVAGYLIGSLSPAREVSRRVAPKQDISKIVLEGVEGAGRFESHAVSSTSVRLHLGPRYGCLVAVLDILKGAVPTLLFRLWLPDRPYYLLVAGMVVIGHNWPIYYRFRGGRGTSPGLGAMLVIDWLGVIITNVLGLASDLVIRMPLLSSGVWLGLMVLWSWLVPRSLPQRIYVMAMALVYSFAMLPEWRQVIRLKRDGKLESLRTARELKVSSRLDGGTAQQASVPDVLSELVSRFRRKKKAGP